MKPKNKFKKWLAVSFLLLITAFVIFYIAGQVARHNLAKQYPAPGIMLNAHSHKLHVYCEGKGPVTILLAAGINDFSTQWSRVQPLLASETKTCSYDRAGLGWSELAAQIPTIENSVTDLHEVLQAIDETHRVILVGHSYGALIVRLYAQQYPEHIKAIVLLDPASENMGERIVGYADVLDSTAARFKSLSTLASLGVIAFSTSSIPVDNLQGEAIAQYRATLASGNFFHAAALETAEMINNLHTMQKIGQQPLKNMPVVIISRGQPEPIPGLPEKSAQSLEQTWSQLQDELVTKLNAKHLIAKKSGHSIPLIQPDLVFRTIQPLIDDAKH